MFNAIIRAALTLALTAMAWPAEARVTRMEIEQRRPYADGRSFGSAGPYEHIVARAYHEIDPADPHNAAIVNLDKAPRNADGKVEFSTTVWIIKPVSMALGNGKIFYDINNRGTSALIFEDDPAKVTRLVATQLKRGFTLVDAGWHGDGILAADRLFAQLPVARDSAGKAIVGMLRLEFSAHSPGFSLPLAESFRPYEPADTDPHRSTLTVRDSLTGVRRPVAASDWAFGTCPSGRGSFTAAPGSICLFGGFDPDKLYELIYPAKNPVVMGLAYAVTRDVASFLRYQVRDDAGTANPLLRDGALVHRAYAYGVSSTGMYLRDWLYLGFNEDEQQRKVFDGAFINTGGALRLFANVEFAHPTFYAAQDGHTDYLSNAYPPFTYGMTLDPVSGVRDGILKRPATDPLLIEAVDENSFWSWKNSLQVVDGRGKPLPIPDNVRLYFKAGAGHLGIQGLLSPPPTPGGRFGVCRYVAQTLASAQKNVIAPPTIAEAAMVALDDWVDRAVPPPPSNMPTLANRNLVTLEEYRRLFPKIPGVQPPGVMAQLNVLDFGPGFRSTGGRLTGRPPRRGAAYRLLVPRPDKDGLAMSDARPIETSVPLGTNVGWNLRASGHRESNLCILEGSFFPFAKTKAERLAAKDPRLSLEERYGDHAGYVAAVKRAADNLVARRYLLAEEGLEWVAAAEASAVLRP